VKWGEPAKKKVANRVYSWDKGNPIGTDQAKANGNEASGDGYRYIGRGLKQLTGKDNTTSFIAFLRNNHISGQPTADQVASDLDLIATNKQLAARSAAWFWQKHYSRNINAIADNLVLDVTPQAEYDAFLRITKKINGGDNGQAARWKRYERNVKAVTTGGNPYESMRALLRRVGVQSTGSAGFESKFGIPLRPLAPVEISSMTGHALRAAGNLRLDLTADPATAGVPAVMADMVDRAKALLGVEGDSAMVIIDVVHPPMDAHPVVVVRPASESRAVVQGMPDMVFCEVVAGNFEGSEGSRASAAPILQAFGPPDGIDYVPSPQEEANAKITILEFPKHGTFTGAWLEASEQLRDKARNEFYYEPEKGFEGPDTAVLLLEIGDVKLTIQYLFQVTTRVKAWELCDEHSGEDVEDSDATDPSNDEGAQRGGVDGSGFVPDVMWSWLDVHGLQNGLVGPANLRIEEMLPNQLGLALEAGQNQSIALSPDAAGHGWFIDYTPLLNEEFLPTADPTVWKAKPGSAAEGKMDMLSVLLHEYGHVLGLEHSHDGSNFMGATLQPGERRLPTEDELRLMAQLVGQLKAGEGTPTPDAPAPLPYIAGFGLLAAIRPRRGEFGLTSSYDNVELSLPQFNRNQNLGVLSPTLVDGELDSPEQWQRAGAVSVADGRAVLGEGAEANSQLAALVPPPRAHLIRFHGIFAPNAALRPMPRRLRPAPTTSRAAPRRSAVR
jgi:predicted chitinase